MKQLFDDFDEDHGGTLDIGATCPRLPSSFLFNGF